eukprot:c52208_g1_i1.p1 GENE.c52208_g1_i1~~c52208_g1_i1.p1  ORF type:complete len:118 (+),score=12.02 c52208_g1_i1:48-401(+)
MLPFAPWAHCMILQSGLLLIGTAIVGSFENEFVGGYSGAALGAIALLEIDHIFSRCIVPWHNYILRGIFYIALSIPLLIFATVAILAGIPALLGGILYLWAGKNGEKYVVTEKRAAE